jgi:hypothetical protein
MSEDKHYAFFVRRSVAYAWAIVSLEGVVTPLTLRDFIDIKIGTFIREGAILSVSFDEFLNDIRQGYQDSKYAQLLKWNYSLAAELIEKEGKVFLVVAHGEARPYSSPSAGSDEEYALQLIRDVYSLSGGAVMWEEFDPMKHVKGYRPPLE